MSNHKVAIVGAGTIGRSWAALFANAGYCVAIFDQNPASTKVAHAHIARTFDDMARFDLIQDKAAALARIRTEDDCEAAIRDAVFIQESVPESVPIKAEAFKTIERFAAPDAILASSASSLIPDEIFGALESRARCLVAHPFNPPHLLPVVEIVPNSDTSQDCIRTTMDLMAELGQSPVLLNKPILGYAINRLQAAVINEAVHLVAEKVISPEDLDLCIRDGLGRRWAFLGPFETMDLNADGGIADYTGKFGEIYAAMGRSLNVSTPWPKEAIAEIVAARRRDVPLAALEARRAWRDRVLMKLKAQPLRLID